MAANGLSPWVASPAANTTACISAMPTSKARSGMASIILPRLVPDGIAAVTPTTRSSAWASSMMASPNTSCHLGGLVPWAVGAARLLPVTLSNGLDCACHFTWSTSAGANPLPLTVRVWSRIGPGRSRKSLRRRASETTSWPSVGPM